MPSLYGLGGIELGYSGVVASVAASHSRHSRARLPPMTWPGGSTP